MFNVFTKYSKKSKTYDIMIRRTTDKSTRNKIVQLLSRSLNTPYYYDRSPEKYKYCSSDYDGYHLQAVKLEVDWNKATNNDTLPKDFNKNSPDTILEMAKELNPNIIAVITTKNCYEVSWLDLNYYRYHTTKPVIYGILDTPAEYIVKSDVKPAITTASNLDVFNNFIKQSIIAGLNDTGIFSKESYNDEPLNELQDIEQTASGDIEFYCDFNMDFRQAICNHLNDCLITFIDNYNNGNLVNKFNELHLSKDSLINLCREIYKSGRCGGKFIFKTDK